VAGPVPQIAQPRVVKPQIAPRAATPRQAVPQRRQITPPRRVTPPGDHQAACCADGETSSSPGPAQPKRNSSVTGSPAVHSIASETKAACARDGVRSATDQADGSEHIVNVEQWQEYSQNRNRLTLCC
jgi:hypothetical protein